MKFSYKDSYIDYEIVGEGYPVLMIHGTYADKRLMQGCMEPVVEKETSFKRIYFDLPGMGNSPASKEVRTADDMLDTVEAFINDVLGENKFSVAAESYGGYIARGVLKRFKERINAMFFIAPIIKPIKSERKLGDFIITDIDKDFLSTLGDYEKKKFTEAITNQVPDNFYRFQKEVLSGITCADKGFIEEMKRQNYAFKEKIDTDVFHGLAFFVAGRHDNVAGYEDIDTILPMFPDHQLYVLDRAGHQVQIDRGNVFSVLLDRWVSMVKERYLD